jgi:aryl-alcohol dehydrogenase-like predicted oxidoreductase
MPARFLLKACQDLVGENRNVGVSNYSAEQTAEISKIFQELRTPFIIHQPRYNMFDRWIEDGLIDVLAEEGIGTITFSPLTLSSVKKGLSERCARESSGIPCK